MRATYFLDHPRSPAGEPHPAWRCRPAPARAKAAPQPARTGMEPFLAASAVGLGLWALLLAPFLL